MKLLETRKREGYTVRRYVDEYGLRTTTWEIPVEVVRGFGVDRMNERIARALRGQQARVVTARNKARLAELLAQRWKPIAIASELGLSDGHVYRMMKAMGAGRDLPR